MMMSSQVTELNLFVLPFVRAPKDALMLFGPRLTLPRFRWPQRPHRLALALVEPRAVVGHEPHLSPFDPIVPFARRDTSMITFAASSATRSATTAPAAGSIGMSPRRPLRRGHGDPAAGGRSL
jgi:hypothetical protein